MKKKYQVFISSTYVDLQAERQKVLKTILEMDCIPAGMELFPATDESQFEFIKKVIDDCDYYLLIIGGRYGSISSSGLSFTEMEYDYAISKKIKVVALLHKSPKNIPMGKSEHHPKIQKKLKQFRDKVKKNRLVKFWESIDELPGLVALGLSKTIATFPAVGWVRGSISTERQDQAIIKGDASYDEIDANPEYDLVQNVKMKSVDDCTSSLNALERIKSVPKNN